MNVDKYLVVLLLNSVIYNRNLYFGLSFGPGEALQLYFS